jgi:hypothetical protein
MTAAAPDTRGALAQLWRMMGCHCAREDAQQVGISRSGALEGTSVMAGVPDLLLLASVFLIVC